jgi:aminoglycoside phosphotransferase (APT) family kinase protein
VVAPGTDAGSRARATRRRSRPPARQWRDEAIAAARRWLSDAAPNGLAGEHAGTLSAALDDGARIDLIETSIVHGDLHHRNCLVDNGTVTSIFDWEIAGPGDWRFDLVTVAFWGLVYPRAADPDACALVLDAIRAECSPKTASMMFACQSLRAISMQSTHRSERRGSTACHIISALEGLLT